MVFLILYKECATRRILSGLNVLLVTAKGNLWLLCLSDVMPILAVQRSVHHLLLLLLPMDGVLAHNSNRVHLATFYKHKFKSNFCRNLFVI